MRRFDKKYSFQLFLLGLWLIFTSSMVAWWWFYGLGQLTNLKVTDLVENEKRHRMIMWEGGAFLTSIFFGAVSLLIYIRRDQRQNQQLKLFFSTFTHELKTSIARLRLQSDVLREQADVHRNPALVRLSKDINRLDLQLENSLLMSRREEEGLLIQKISLSSCLNEIRSEWEDLQIQLKSDAFIDADRRAFLAILRNLFHNSILHGSASEIVIQPEILGSGFVLVHLKDNGRGTNLETARLGQEILSKDQKESHGLGLYLVRQLTEQMKGKVQFESQKDGFLVSIKLKGSKT